MWPVCRADNLTTWKPQPVGTVKACPGLYRDFGGGGRQPPVGQSLLIHEVSRPHNDAPQTVGLLWTSDKLVAETST